MTFSRSKIHLPVLAILMLAGCASAPIAGGDVERSATLLEGALAAEAEVHAPVELRFAQEGVAQARAARDAGDEKRAARFAAQAEADAELAMARTRVAKLRAEVEIQSRENAKLRAELLGEGA